MTKVPVSPVSKNIVLTVLQVLMDSLLEVYPSSIFCPVPKPGSDTCISGIKQFFMPIDFIGLEKWAGLCSRMSGVSAGQTQMTGGQTHFGGSVFLCFGAWAGLS